MDLHLTGKVALVLASSKGLGKAIAMALATEGAKVAIASRDVEELERTAAEIRASTGAQVVAIQADVSNAEDIGRLIQRTGNELGPIHILVNNAGGPPFAPFEQFEDEQWQQAFDQNLLSFVRTSRLVLPMMKAIGSGRIINIISGSVKAVLDNSVLSTSMRMGVVGMAKLLADEVGPHQITVNNVAPGLILTDRIKHTLPAGIDVQEALDKRAANIPLRRIGQPQELADLVTFLASDRAAYITGQTIQVDGGAGRNIY